MKLTLKQKAKAFDYLVKNLQMSQDDEDRWENARYGKSKRADYLILAIDHKTLLGKDR